MSGRRPAGGMEAMVGRKGMSMAAKDKPVGGGIIVDNRPKGPTNVDEGVHPAVAAMRIAGAKKAPRPVFDARAFGLGKLDELNNELSNKRKGLQEPVEEEKSSKHRKKEKRSKKKDKDKKKSKDKKEEKKSKTKKKSKNKNKKKQASTSSSESGSSSSSSS
mmetsp:Transcript_121576/g.389015  ORF Transcript_121576/g.389015 Transcript_121576/m.389015 type:complete len:161 (-) Transcript_121576:140-622(-)